MSEVGLKDVGTVGGKNAGLGEMMQALRSKGVRVPDGFIITAQAFRDFIEFAGLRAPIEQQLSSIRPGDLGGLATVGAAIRQSIMQAPFPPRLEAQILDAYHQLQQKSGPGLLCAVRTTAWPRSTTTEPSITAKIRALRIVPWRCRWEYSSSSAPISEDLE